MSVQEREAIIKLKTQNKAIRETAKPSGTFNLLHTETPERPQRTTEVHRGRIISTVKQNSFTKSNQVKNKLKEITAEVYNKETGEWKYSEFPITSKALVTL